MSARARVKLMGSAALGVAFGLGVGTGVVLERRGGGGPEPLEEPRPTAPAVALPGTESVFDGMELDPEQRASVDSILSDFSAWTDSTFGSQHGALVERANATQAALLAVLSPSQRETYLSRVDSVGAMVRVRRVRAPEGGEGR